MLTKRIIPCLDVKAGRVVKGVKFLDHRDAGDPVEMANRYNTSGADELVFYDITASVEGRGIMQDVVSRVADQIFIPLTVGGGLRTIEDMKQMLESGADKVSVNTAAVENPHLISESADRFGSQCIVLGLDAIRISEDSNRWEVKVKTGRDGGNRTGLDAVEWAIKAAELGAGEVVVNSIDRDGTRDGYDIDLLKQISESVKIPVVASGGAGHPKHMLSAITEGKADAVLAASIFHYSTHSISGTKSFLNDNGVAVRPLIDL
ncbi:MAG: imidazole glycerol phosphate synthase subunit HisF [Chloroflexota bacterium]|nr:imidazole glycerol phosphate synthase subunit HisF [Chloroflexota bacterium]